MRQSPLTVSHFMTNAPPLYARRISLYARTHTRLIHFMVKMIFTL
jgi:hypothetical protein